jgi:hypothetical protein
VLVAGKRLRDRPTEITTTSSKTLPEELVTA